VTARYDDGAVATFHRGWGWNAAGLALVAAATTRRQRNQPEGTMMSSGQTLPSDGPDRVLPGQQDQHRQLRRALAALALPAFFVIGFVLCYTSALQAPVPHGVPVAVAGPAAQTARLRDGLARAVGPAFDVRAVPAPAAAAREVRDQDLDGAYVPAARPGGTATVIVAAAAGDSVTSAVESLFRAVAAKQGAPLAVRDVRPLPAGDASGLSLFFFMVACTLGGFLAVTATGLAAPALRPRYRWPLFLAVVVAAPVLAYLLAGPGLGAIGGQPGAVVALLGAGALYVLAITMITRGLQLILGVIGTLFAGLTVFVLLGFPSSGDSIQGPMLPAFWHVLNRFWIGASASDAFRGIVYFGGQGAGTGVLKLLGWLAVGVVLLALGWFKRQRGRQEVTPAGTDAAEEPERSPANS
jgi:hypothetical protein